MAFPALGSPAPDFTITNQDNEMVSLLSYRDKFNVLLYFYPKAMTPGCTVQACGIRDSEDDFSKYHTMVFGISPDNPAKLKKFKEKEDLNFNLLSDANHSVAESYGAWGLKKFMGKEYMGVLRCSFIIDRCGNIVHIVDKVKTKSHHSDTLEWIKTNLES